jgi:solute carrier family 39 (zinc transporter), member 9
LSFSLSQRQLRIISTIGTGVLVGTALIVIIPEGIETLYSSASIPQPSTTVTEPAAKGGLAPVVLHKHPKPDGTGNRKRFMSLEELHIGGGQDLSPSHISIVRRVEDESKQESGHDNKDPSPHAWIGLSLVTGFILMYLIDTLPALGPTPSLPPQHISLHNLGSASPDPNSSSPHSHKSSTTIGLVIHAVADGIALGASTATPTTKTTLGLIVFTAIMLHKGPAAFGLTSVLLKQGLSKRSARAHLAIFSLAAPVGAIGTWMIVNLVGRAGLAGNTEKGDGVWWTGIVLIFSGGTFL